MRRCVRDKEMRKKGLNNLRVAMVFVVFSIMFFSQITMAILSVIAFRFGLIHLGGKNGLLFILFMLITSVILVTVITGIYGKKALLPIRRLTQATKEVAKGNFNVHVETYGNNEFDDLTRSFNKMVKELGSVEIMRTDFVTSISHEFKTPIASIQGYATLLQDEELSNDERREYTDMIIAATRQLSSLSGNILMLSKLENQGIITKKTEFELDEQIRSSILLLEPGWSGKNIELDIELDPVRYTGSAELLHQVWMNLLDNAIKFTDDGGKISVSLSEGKDGIVAVISDDGIGMDSKTVKHVFDKFYQGDKSRSSEGNGLGLPLVKRIVEMCGGSISVKSEVGKGSVFTVVL